MTNRTRGRPKGGWIPDAERKPAIRRLRERHHTIAKLLATGQTRNVVAAMVNMTPERVGQLYNDPSVQDLIAQYRSDPDVVRAQGIDFIAFQRQQMAGLNQQCLDSMAEQLAEAEELGTPIPFQKLLRATEVFSDRIGLGKHTTQTHVYDFAAELETRRIARMKTIEAKATPQHPGPRPLLLEGGVAVTTSPSTQPMGDGTGGRASDNVPDSVPSLRRRSL